MTKQPLIDTKPVALGGDPIAVSELPFVRPLLPQLDQLAAQYGEILASGIVTTGPYAEKLGETIREHMGVKKAVAVSSCTTGLLLSVQALNLPLGSEVILPSFTFIASGLGPVWNGLKLRFVDVDRETMNLDPALVEEAINDNTSLIIGVHQFGAPAEIEALQAVADKHNVALMYDAAHGLGTLHQGKPVGGFGKVEVFSLSPTKVMIAGEGGIVSTNDEAIGDHVYIGRNYANPGNYDCFFPGLNARMSEFHAILALHSFEMLESAATHRNRMAELYRNLLSDVPGISFQKIMEGDRSSYKDLSIVIDDDTFGLTQPQLTKALLVEGIHSRVYYKPILHEMSAFKQFAEEGLLETIPNSIYLANHALSLPLYSDMTDDEVNQVCSVIKRIHAHAKALAEQL